MRLVIFIFLSILFCPTVFAGEPPTEPILRLETGMHTAVVRRIGVDASESYLVSASMDKTLRLWSLPDLHLLKTLRVPIGAGDEGKLYATAISPNAELIAAAGWTGWDWDGTASIYIFNRSSGDIVKRISGLGNVIMHLSFSADGHYLAASLGSGQGMRVWHTSNWALVGEDTDYGSDSYWCDFSSDGRLVTSSYDGYLRLYDKNFRLLHKRKAAGGNQPFAAVFSPDGKKIAVGFSDSTAVNVLSSDDLDLLYAPDSTGINNGSMSSTAWSADGRYLYAGGKWNTYKVRRWSESGSFRDFAVADDTIMDIRPLAAGVVVGSGGPAITILDSAGLKKQRASGIADYRDGQQKFLISRDGNKIKFGFKPFGKSPALFDLAARQLTTSPKSTTALLAPNTDSLNIQNWKYTTHPTLNGKPLKLQQYETSRSLAIAGDSFLLGTNWWLRRFDKSGRELWQQPVPAVAWGVNISGDGKLAVAAFGDGTIRWYRYSDGELLLSFFPHKDKKRWILWTPTGYYDASAGAEDLIGWHVNNGKDAAANFYPASKFRSHFYRPDIVARILQAGSESKAIQLADAERGRKTHKVDITSMLPPTISILSPDSGSSFSGANITLRYKVRSGSDTPITAVRALVDGRPINQGSGVNIKGKGGAQSITIPLPAKDVTIALLAENRFATSEAAIIRLHWRGKTPVKTKVNTQLVDTGFIIKPKLYVLAVGVSEYDNKSLKLGLPAKDARDFANVMRTQKGSMYRDMEIKTLTNNNATADAILDGLDWLTRQTTSKDVAMLFLAGHGVNDNSGDYYFLPSDVNLSRLRRTGVPFYEIKKTLESLAGKAVFFVDSCHSGNVMGTRRGIADINAVINELSAVETGTVVFSASTGSQYSLENSAWGNGAFTKALVEGLSGKADFHHTGRITINMLDLYISERVKELTQGQQTPTTHKPPTIADFPIAVQ
ncbi:MAG: caspase family protein [Mariprofundales bacterium]